MKTTKLLIVADDFTGGLDTGVQFSQLGISVQVAADPLQAEEWDDLDAEVLVVAAETRHLQAGDAYNTVHRIVSQGVNPVTLHQLDCAEEHGFKRFHLSAEQTQRQDTHLRLPASEKWLLIDTVCNNDSDGMDKKHQNIMEGVADVFERAVLSCDSPVLITGGDTLVSCLKRIGVRKIVPLLELFPGVVLSEIRTPHIERLIITKSGGFGKKTLITDLRNLIEDTANKLL